MILGLKRQISKFIQSVRLKRTEIPNFQEIHQCPQDGISSCPVEKNTTGNGIVLPFQPDFVKHTSMNIDFLQNAASNSEVSKSSDNKAPNVLAKTVLTDIYEQAENYGKNQAIKINRYFDGESYVDIPKNENVVVELSNKSIGNPFHVSHLRNIMIGRFITNISKLFNKNVTYVNYLQDWMDMINALVCKRHEYRISYRIKNKEDDLFHSLNLVDVLEEIPKLNYMKPTEVADKMHKQLAAHLNSPEQGDQKALEIWQKSMTMRKYTKLDIKFDATYAESQYTEQANKIISLAKEMNLLRVNEGKQVIYVSGRSTWKPPYIDFSLNSFGPCFPRVIAAAFDRFNTYSADRIIYLTDLDESDFKSFQRVVKKLRPDQPGRIEYAKTGKMPLYGINSPKLSKMLDEFMNSKTAIMLKHKLWEDNESLSDVTDKLSICQLVVYNFKNKKYLYHWRYPCMSYNNLQESFGSHLNASLQHSYVRLCRLIRLCNDDYSFKSIDFNLLSEDCAIRLIKHLASYHEVLIESYMELQSYHLIQYLITLANLEHLAHNELLVLNQPKEIRDARLTLFICTRQVLENGMNILGIQPLGKI